MLFRSIVVIFLLAGPAAKCFAQQPVDTVLHKPDSLSQKTGSAGTQVNNISPAAYNNTTRLSGRDYFILSGSNLKQGFTKPFHMTRRDWVKFLTFSFALTAAGFADEPIQKEALELRTRSGAVRNTGNYISRFGGLYELYSLAGFGAYGLAARNQKIKTTTLLATQAYITGGVIEAVLKKLTNRTRPNYYGVYEEAEPAFKGPFGNNKRNAEGKRTNGSFPSGHSTVAFAAATVFAKEYRDRPLIPVFAYTAASLIGISRITENKHWATDVLAGAVLGYLAGRQVVNNYHRFAKIKYAEKKKAQLTYYLQYHFGKIMPALVYKF